MEPKDATVEILRDIRDDIREMKGEIRQTNARVDDTNAKLDALRADTNARFDAFARRQTETEIRLATEIIAVAGAVREVRDVLRDDLALRARVDDHERRLEALEHRS